MYIFSSLKGFFDSPHDEVFLLLDLVKDILLYPSYWVTCIELSDNRLILEFLPFQKQCGYINVVKCYLL